MRVRKALAAAALVATAARPIRGASWPALPSGPLQDDSFLVEEAYNQEAGVVQSIVETIHDRRSQDWLFTFTQEWPVPDERHQLSFTVPYTFAKPNGPGDVFLNYRYQALTETARRPALAPRLSLLLPTGSQRDELGTGSAGVQALVPASKQFTRHWAGHLNLGGTIIPHALASGGRAEQLLSGNVGASLVWLPADGINVLAEVVASRDQEIVRHGVTTRTHATFDPGVRAGWDGPGGIQLVWGVGFPIGLTAASDDFGVLLYVSLENPFTHAAREKRSW